MYIQSTYDLGWMRIVEKHYPGNYGAPGRKRGKKLTPTPEAVKKHNEQLRIRKLQMLIAANFHTGDLHVILTYNARDRPTLEEARKSLKNFLSRIRREYRARGQELKWIGVTEVGKHGLPHHHLVLNGIGDALSILQKHWPNRVFATPLSPDIEAEESGGTTGEDYAGEYYGLASYLQKKATKEPIEAEDEKAGKKWSCRYSHSRNLIVPQPMVEKIHRKRWSSSPKPPKGWYIAYLSNGVNTFTQMPCQRYIMRRLERRKNDTG